MIKRTTIEEYKLFLKDIPREEVSVFNQSRWLELYESTIEVFGIFEKGERQIGVFYFNSGSEKGVSLLKTPSYSPHCGLILKNASSNASKRISQEKKIMAELADFLLERKEKIVFIAFPPEFIDMQPFLWKQFKVTPQYTYRMSLEMGKVDIDKRMAPERRNDIKRAAKDGVTAEQTQDYSVVEGLIEKTFSRKSKGFDSNFVHKILFEFANESNSAAFVSEYKGNPVAASFFIHNDDTVYYLLGGYDHEKGHAAAGALALHTGINWCIERKIKTFDFEGSMLPEVEKYFRGFGPDLTPYYLVHKANKALEIALKFKKPELF